jgi:hypothetical protein
MEERMMKAREWIDRAIACGRNPVLIPQRDGSFGLLTSLVDIDEEQDPGPMPDAVKVGVRKLLQKMGAYRCTHEAPSVDHS